VHFLCLLSLVLSPSLTSPSHSRQAQHGRRRWRRWPRRQGGRLQAQRCRLVLRPGELLEPLRLARRLVRRRRSRCVRLLLFPPPR
jgi:hypothetical protein